MAKKWIKRGLLKAKNRQKTYFQNRLKNIPIFVQKNGTLGSQLLCLPCKPCFKLNRSANFNHNQPTELKNLNLEKSENVFFFGNVYSIIFLVPKLELNDIS